MSHLCVASRLAATPRFERFSESDLPTEHGTFRIFVFRDATTKEEHVALVRGEVAGSPGVLTRVHSECLTSEVFGSLRCDCRAQLMLAMEAIAKAERGVIIYLRQEGRGIGLGNKIRAYALQQESGLDTIEANRKLGFADDLRRYDVAAQMLRNLGVLSVDLMTNNPNKVKGLTAGGIEVKHRLPSATAPNPENLEYLKTKRDRCGHMIDLPVSDEST